MQIVIDIPDRIYKIVQKKTLNVIDDEIIEQAIKNGTPLPKGHGRLIDAGAIDTKWSDPEVSETLDEAPTIIEADKGRK